MTLRLVILPAVIAIVSISGFSQNTARQQDEYDKDLDLAQEYAGKALLDKALVVLQNAADRAKAAGKDRRAAEIRMSAANLYREQGMKEQLINTLLDAAALAKGTDLEIPFTCQFQLALSEVALEQGKLSNALEGIGEVYANLPKIQSELLRTNVESTALTLREKIQFKVGPAIQPEASSAGVSEDGRKFLEVLLSDDLTKRPSTVTGSAEFLDARRPWNRTMLEVALKINGRVTEIDRRYENPKLRDLEVAKDISHRGTILGDLGQLDEAIRLKKSTLEIFDKYNVFADSVVDLDNLCSLNMEKGDFVESLRYSLELVGRIESQTFVQVGQTVVPFLQQYEDVYNRHAVLLWKQYQTLLAAKHENTEKALNAFLIHADRSNFRAARRDMAIYHDLGTSVGADPEMARRVTDKLQDVFRAQKETEKAIAEGKRPEDFQPTPGFAQGPFVASEFAKRDFITALEDLKRKETKSIGTDPTITAAMSNVTAGMTGRDGILTYFETPEGGLHAAVITAASTQIYPLANDAAERVPKLISGLQRQIAIAPQKILQELSSLLLGPLPAIPPRLTIVLSSDVLGIPFEALTTSDGRLLVEDHDIRYAFGLYRAAGASVAPTPIRRAMVVGAEAFEDSSIEPLPQSRREVEGIRAMLSLRKVEITPAASLPDTGSPLLAGSGAYQLIHISTHSKLDNRVPILDALLFPKDRIYAHQFALAPVRSAVIVLSACELYRPRADRLYPVSGLVTAALSRIAPQVVSPLWKVNAAATYLFILRFYSALAEDGDTAAALARTKRDFAAGEPLRQWVAANHVDDLGEVDITEYRKPYYWAPFVLSVGVTTR